MVDDKTPEPNGGDLPSTASRRLGVLSLLAAFGPFLSACFMFAHFAVYAPLARDPDWILVLAWLFLFAPSIGLLLGLVGVGWKGRASRFALAGLVLNLLWGELFLAIFLIERVNWDKQGPPHRPVDVAPVRFTW